jgi:FAD/FMN-containing dehydrogenase
VIARCVHRQTELDRATGAFGLATLSGVVSTTGIAGLTLGGGIAWLMGKHGMAVDNLLSAELVLTSGEVVTTSEDTNRDLFWALRGGGAGSRSATRATTSTGPRPTCSLSAGSGRLPRT